MGAIDQKKILIATLAIAALLRILWAIVVPVLPVSDGLAYDAFAQSIISGNGYSTDGGLNPTAYWPVGTSAIYSILFFAFGHTYVPIVILNIVLGTAVVFVTMSIACNWFGAKVAIVAGVIVAVWPTQIQFTTILASDLIFQFLVVLAWRVWQLERFGHFFRAILLAVTVATASYVRTVALLLPVAMIGSYFFESRKFFRCVVVALIIVATMALLISPWSYRNTQLFGRFTLLATNSGSVLWMGNNPTNPQGGYMKLPTGLPENEAESSSILGKQAVDYILAEPSEFLLRTINKVVRMHARETIGVHWNEKGILNSIGQVYIMPLKIVSTGYWMVVLFLGFIGFVILVRKRGALSAVFHPTVLTIAYFAILYGVAMYSDRYHLSSSPYFAVLAGLAVATLAGRCGATSGR